MEEYRNLEVTMISADHYELEKKEYMYVVIYVSGHKGLKEKFKSPVCHETNGRWDWNFTVTFPIAEARAQRKRPTLVMKIMAKRSDQFDKFIGEVRYPIKELHEDCTDKGKPIQFFGGQPASNYVGNIDFAYKFGEIYRDQKLNKPFVNMKAQPVYTSWKLVEPVVTTEAEATCGQDTSSGTSLGFGSGFIGRLRSLDFASHARGDGNTW